ncbi:MAG: SDR family oxidoreductase [Proteobacteria bacterium]|nr:SDR family oxidoreductase [Pseudomonadota bacterium]
MSIIAKLFDLSGRTALVTGGSSGIGRTIAAGLAEAGASVVHAALEKEESSLRDAAETVERQGGRAAYATGDVTETDRLADLVENVCSFFGSPDILVNAAGINLRQSWEEVSLETWNQTIAVNLSAPFFLARLLIPAMREKGWGKILNIASLQSVRAFPNSAPYGASKGGVMQLTRAMAEAWSVDQSGISCNAIAPGFFKTGLTAPLYEDRNVIDSLARQTIIGRNGEPEDLKGVAIFLASPASDYITGQTVFLDGGWTAK